MAEDKDIERLEKKVELLRKILTSIDNDVDRAARKYLKNHTRRHVNFAQFLSMLERMIRKDVRAEVEAIVVKRTFVTALEEKLESLFKADWEDYITVPVLLRQNETFPHERDRQYWKAHILKGGLKQVTGRTQEMAYHAIKERIAITMRDEPERLLKTAGVMETSADIFFKARPFKKERMAGFTIDARVEEKS